MTNIQEKSLKHIRGLLGKVDSYKIYIAVQRALEENQVSKEAIKAVTDALNEAKHQEFNKVEEAKEWLDVLLSDPS